MPVSDALYKKTNGDYYFICMQAMDEERKKLGYETIARDYVLDYYKYSKKCEQLIISADCVIFGDAPYSVLSKSVAGGKILFHYSERLLKNGFQWWKYPYRFIKLRKKYPAKANMYLLCAGAYVAADYAKFGLFKNRSFKWGYFPETRVYKNVDGIIEKKEQNSILWAGRFLDWKHPEIPVIVAKMLKENGYDFSLTMIGIGVEKEKTQELVNKYGLRKEVKLIGSMSPDSVREYMEKSEIFLFTSDRREGWGAVLNESMNSGCAVIANKAIGSVPYLIKDGENGIVYSSDKTDEIYKDVVYLLDNPEVRKTIGKNAYNTITKTWNADIATEKLIDLYQHLSEDKEYKVPFDGPCAKINQTLYS